MDILGTIGWRTEVDTSGVGRDVAAAEAEIQAATNRIDRMRGYAEAGIKVREFERDAAKLRATIAALDREKINIEANIENAAARGGSVKAWKNDLDELNRTLKLEKQRLKEVTAARGLEIDSMKRHRGALDATNSASNRLVLQYAKERQQLDALRESYTKLASRHRELAKLRERLIRSPAELAEVRRVNSDLDLLRRRIHALGGDTDDIDAHVRRTSGSFLAWAKRIGETRVHIGFLSTTMRGLIVGSLALSPVITGLVGALGALVAVVGSGVIGAAGVGIAGLAAFGLAAGGVAMAITPFATQLSSAIGLTQDYHEAVQKYGRGSEKAKAAQEKMNDALKRMPEPVQKAAKAFAELRNRWTEMTRGARGPFFDIVNNGLVAANRLLPMFARNTVDTMNVLREATDKAFDRLSGPRTRQALDTLMDNFNAALPNLVSGFAKLGAAFTNIFASFSRHFPRLTGGFDKWASGILRASNNTSDLNRRVDEVMRSAERLTEFLAAAGRVLFHFFEAGDNSGRGFLQSMTKGLNDIDRWLTSVGGRNELDSFFRRSIDTTQRLWGAVSNLTETFLDLSEALRPVTNGILTMVQAFTGLLNTLMDLPVVGDGIKHLMTAIGALMGAKFLGGMLTRLPMIGGLLGGFGAKSAGASKGLGTFSRMGAAASAFLAGPWVGAIAVAGVAMLELSGHTDDMTQSLERSAAAAQQSAAALNTLEAQDIGVAQSRLQLRNANQAVAQAQQRVNALEAAGRRGSAAYRQAVDDLYSAQLNRQAAAEGLRQTEQRQNQALVKGVSAARFALQQAREAANGYRERIEKLSEVSEAKVDEGMWEDLTDAEKEAHKALVAYESAMGDMLISTTNAVRQQQGLVNISHQVRAQVGRIQRMIGSRATQRLLLQVDDTAALRKISNLTRKLNAAGQGDVVKNVLVNARGQDQIMALLRQIDRFTPDPKTVDIKQRGADAVIGIISRIIRTKLPGKSQVLGERGGSNVLGTIVKIGGMVLNPKTLHITGDNSSAMSAWGAVNALPDTETIHRIVTKHINFAGGGLVPAFASGGDTDAARAGTRHNRSGRFTRPTMLVGEENRPEIVIASNPAYRDSNERYLQMAADMLGWVAMPGFRKGGPRVSNDQPGANQLGRITRYETASAKADYWGQLYSDERNQQETLIQAGNLDRLRYGELFNYLDNQKGAYHDMSAALQAQIEHALKTRKVTIKQANKYGDKRVASLAKQLGQERAKLEKMPKPSKGMSSERRSEVQSALSNQKSKVENLEGRLKSAKDARKDRVRSASNTVTSLNDQIADWVRERKFGIPGLIRGVNNTRQELELMQANKLPEPGDEDATGGGAPSASGEVGMLQAARYELFKQFGSNFTGTMNVLPSVGGPTQSAGSPTGAYSGAGSTPSPYQTGGGTTTEGTGAYSGTAPRIVQNINITESPPDPHVFSQQLAFEAQTAY